MNITFQHLHLVEALSSMCHNSAIHNRIWFTVSDWDSWLLLYN